ncbi:MAG: aminotransferase class III-fold pyridoxal phosphate-dependent enzyme, partial [Methanobacterium paludis]|nr:aminotransferase class III-fold pyridoxal phosphate-dependent enzyme [Methanobacterium paludis]
VKDVRGCGLMLGMEMEKECGVMVDDARERGLIINCTAGNVLRFVPPLMISKDQIDAVASMMDEIIGDFA